MSEIDLAAVRARLHGATGRLYWRSLEEIAATDDFQELLHREFPSQASEFTDPVGRREFLKLMGASLALAGVTACTRQPAEQIVPYVRPPEEIVPGRPLYFATAMSLAGSALGLLVESHMGRPTKVEGNPDHPASLGATDIFAQAAILSLYDPDRSQTLTRLGEVRPWGEFIGALQSAVAAQRPKGGAGLRILTETVNSPALADQIRAIVAELPQARWHQYEPAGRDHARAGARLAFGQYADVQYRFRDAQIILSLDADFLSCGPGHVRYTRDFSARRRIESANPEPTRLYVVESTPTNTGARADHRLPLRAREIEGFARALAAALNVGSNAPRAVWTETQQKWLASAARDLQAHRGSSIVIAGDHQPAIVHALAHAMNDALGNTGRTVIYTDPVEAEPVDQQASLAGLAADMHAGRVEVLVILGGNPVFTAPVDLRFTEALDKVALRAHLSLYDDETSERCHWHIAEAHFLESWGDARGHDGTVTIVQPLIAPLYSGRTAHEVLATLTNRPDRSPYEIVRDFWQRAFKERSGAWGPLTDREGRPFADFDRFWRRALHDGVMAGTALPVRKLALGTFDQGAAAPAPDAPAGLEIIFKPDATIFDGRFANNGWLQELPKPLTKVTWDNLAFVAPATAERMHLETGDVADLAYRGRSVRVPIWVLPGHPSDSVTVHFGYGRTRSGRLGTGAGYNGYAIRTSDAPWIGSGLEIRKTGERATLATTQTHFSMENRHLVRAGTVEEYRRNPTFIHKMEEAPPRPLTMYPEYKYEGYKWGMAIDLTACTGCSACVLACVSENNIPVVGKTQVVAQREMHWLRVDRYYEGDLDNPQVYHQPVPCMHCENAPCEVVCPVAATVHSTEGLNEMVYNRCVGTRYCSNNCPYKVRRFNFLLFQDFTTPSLKLPRNPDVTVRSRGVMEKCTYCVQRINYARIDAEREDRPIRDGEIVTACQQVCPAEAIVFGDLNDPKSRVAQLKAEERNYGLLEDLNTRPRTTYLADLRNPSPDLEPANPSGRPGSGREPSSPG